MTSLQGKDIVSWMIESFISPRGPYISGINWQLIVCFLVLVVGHINIFNVITNVYLYGKLH